MDKEVKYDVLGIGNAIVDVVAKVDENFIDQHSLTKGAMTLIDAERALYLSGHVQDTQVKSGGSAGNTIAAIADLGGRAAFFGQVADDELGAQYRKDLTDLNVYFPSGSLAESEPTARCIIVVTPDGERTMNTYLGACLEIGPEDMEDEVVNTSSITYFEGYLWDPPRAKDALRRAAEMAHKEGHKVALTLSDAFCVDRYRSEFRELITSKTVDIIFANEGELLSLYESDNLDIAARLLGAECELAAVTLGDKGAFVLRDGVRTDVPPYKVYNVVDTTGAGDMFAAGFLYGITHGMNDKDAARLGCLLASQVIQVIGPRLDSSLVKIAQKAGFDIG